MSQRCKLTGVLVAMLVVACGPSEVTVTRTEGLPSDNVEVVEVADDADDGADDAPAEDPPVDVPPADVPPADVPPADVPPADEPPADEPPVEEPPVDVPPVDEPIAPTTVAPAADCLQVRVADTGGVTLNVRPDPSTALPPIGALAVGAVVDVLAVAPAGQEINGDTTWYEIDDGDISGFVSGAFAVCFDASARAPGFFLPLTCGRTARITQGNNSDFSHNGRSRFAFDFSLPRGTPLVAIDDGVVAFADGSTRPGDRCWSGGDSSCINDANYIVIRHGDGTQSMYAHLDEPALSVGDAVLRGEVVGLSGGTGWSTGPHAHVARIAGCGTAWCSSIAVTFQDVGGDGVPDTGQSVTSRNCP